MKTLKEHIDDIYIQSIVEKLKPADEGILTMLNFFAKNSSGYQQKLFQDKLNDSDSVDIVSIYDVFDEETIEKIKRYVRPQPKCCYENAYKLCDRIYDKRYDIKYCEGYLNMKGLPIDHAFNSVNGQYVDITIELALERELEDTYVKYCEYDVDKVREILLQNGYYGNIYDTIKLNKYKEK